MADRRSWRNSFVEADDTSLGGSQQYPQHAVIPSSPPPYDFHTPQRDDEFAPPPPAHRSPAMAKFDLPPLNTQHRRVQEEGEYTSPNRTASSITPGADNMGSLAAGGGIAGVAYGVAQTNQRESGMDATRAMERVRAQRGQGTERILPGGESTSPRRPDRRSIHEGLSPRDPFATPTPSGHSNPFDEHLRSSPSPRRGLLASHESRSSMNIPMAEFTPSQESFHDSTNYRDNPFNPYNRASRAYGQRFSHADINPDEIEDDGDEMISEQDRNRSRAVHDPNNGQPPITRGIAAGGAGAYLGAVGGKLARSVSGAKHLNNASSQQGLDSSDNEAEKSEWLHRQTSGRRRLRWIVGIIILIIIIGAIVGGVIGGLKHSNDSPAPAQGKSAAQDDGSGDLDKNSAEIKKLLNNPNLHRVFPGMDYTPFNAQYPDCLSNPPSQNNVTRDVAVLSQLTNTIRLYGTDCNQTDMVIHAISKLGLSDIKIWLGVWLDGNSTTNDRGINGMYDILQRNGPSPFAGVIIGNEVLYRKDMTAAQLGTILASAKSNFTTLKYDLPVATSDLGDDWTATLAADVDVVMSNIHPFFAGVTADIAAGWTWDFWQQHDIILTQGTNQKNIISEVGWPSGGGTDCGQATSCAIGSVAGIDEMNTFMNSFICQSLANGTNFFWFEAFDEPWKVQFNTPGKAWEDKWGLMDPGRTLKPGLKIPDCGGKTIS